MNCDDSSACRCNHPGSKSLEIVESPKKKIEKLASDPLFLSTASVASGIIEQVLRSPNTALPKDVMGKFAHHLLTFAARQNVKLRYRL